MSEEIKGVIYRQYDPQWVVTPGADWNLSDNGCGPTACANILANSINPKITPVQTWNYMNSHNYICADGSLHSGITACLKEFGVESTYVLSPSSSKVFELMVGHKYAILLFGNEPQGGVTWAISGHFVAATDYKIEDGKHWFFTRDSSGKKNDGWHCYEDTMSKVLAAFYVCTNLTGGTAVVDSGQAIVLENQIAKLYSSDNYTFIHTEEEANDKPTSNVITERFKAALNTLSQPVTENSANEILQHKESTPTSLLAIIDSMLPSIVGGITRATQEVKSKISGTLLSYPTVVEAPVIVLNMNGVVIGGYGNFGDRYPNYISSMTVDKTSGRINQYRINLVYQVRFGEDPNFIDKLLSKTGFTNKIQILYGDANGGKLFRDDEALVTDVTFNENVATKSISYTITATSSIISASSAMSNYSAKTDKPSNLIRKLFYSSNDTSRALLSSFSGMAQKTLVESSGLIPTNDSVVRTQPMINVSPLAMLNYYVSGMYNENTNSLYALTYHDDTTNEFNGPYIKIISIGETDSSTLDGGYFEIDVGYPGDNFVINFSVDNGVYFPLVYKYNQDLPKWVYDIDNDGNIYSTKTNSLVTNNKFNRPNVIMSEWWKRVTEYPISATLTIKGLMKAVMLGSYIRVNVLFYGNQDLASGLYVITGQSDSISGSGYITTLSLLRVGS